MGIARGLGNLVRVDLATLRFQCARFARICVEVNLTKPLKGSVKINGERYYVAYEGLSNICSGCGIYGHLVHNCPKRLTEQAMEKKAEKAAEKARSSDSGQTRAPKNVGDGFTVVRRGGKTNQSSARGMVFAARESETDLGRNLQDISGTTNMENIDVSNSFVALEEEMISLDSRVVDISVTADKENADIQKYARKGKSIAQGCDNSVVCVFDEGRKGNNDGPRNRRNGGFRIGEPNGPRPKQMKNNRPTRGKRLRVENGIVGRQCGSFTAERHGQPEPAITVPNSTSMEDKSLENILANES